MCWSYDRREFTYEYAIVVLYDYNFTLINNVKEINNVVSPAWEDNCEPDLTGEDDDSAVWCSHKAN